MLGSGTCACVQKDSRGIYRSHIGRLYATGDKRIDTLKMGNVRLFDDNPQKVKQFYNNLEESLMIFCDKYHTVLFSEPYIVPTVYRKVKLSP
jgi:hypothetical protein